MKIRTHLVCLFLVIATIGVYWNVCGFDFVNYDDPHYVAENPQIQKGLTTENIFWAFTANVGANWHPLTLLSHMLDCQLFGLDAGFHHLTNLFFHISNTLLLFIVFKKMTGTLWQSSFIAAMFALHPLHVESVAWISERKDVLSTFFWMLTMWSYARYSEQPGVKRYLPVCVLLLLGLMAKPMLVTLPFVLLLLDYWPLGRMWCKDSALSERSASKLDEDQLTRDFMSSDNQSNDLSLSAVSKLFMEKIPLFLLVTGSCIVTLVVQQDAGAVVDFVHRPFSSRIVNALVSYAIYIFKTVFPYGLSAYYPYSNSFNLIHIAGAVLLLGLLSLLAIKTAIRHPYVLVGWCWYLGTLVPVIGLVQVGGQSMADRYTYIPLIGIFIMISWGIPVLLKSLSPTRRYLIKPGIAMISVLLIPVLAAASRSQVQYWKNSLTLWSRAIDVSKSRVAHTNLGIELMNRHGKIREAIVHFRESLRLDPNLSMVNSHLAVALAKIGKTEEAISRCREALRLDPENTAAHNNFGNILTLKGDTTKAISHYKAALKTDPEYVDAHLNLGLALMGQGDVDKAIEHYIAALKINSSLPNAHFMLGNAMLGKGKIKDAIFHFQEALRMQPNVIDAHVNLGYALFKQGREDEAVKHCLEAIRLDPDRSINAYYNLACIYARKNKKEESVAWLKKAIDRGFDNWELLKADKDLENIRKSSFYRKLDIDDLVRNKKPI